MDDSALRRYEMFAGADGSSAEGMRTIMGDFEGRGMVWQTPDIEFAAPQGRTLRLQLLRPAQHWYWEGRAPAPLIVFVQGSSWTHPDMHGELPQLARFAREGYVVASVEHRSSSEAAFPACLVDVKSAIRFLRAHAAEYGIDPTRVAIWGTSSGGNLALLTAATRGQDEFEQGEYLDESSSVQAVVDFFGPSDPCEMMRLSGIAFEDLERDEYRIIGDLIGGVEGDARGRMARLAPGGYLEEGMLLPPHLIMHGDCDTVVPFSQSLNYYRLLRERGQTAFLVKVCGAEHERRFWSDRVLDEVSAFLRAYL